LFVVGG